MHVLWLQSGQNEPNINMRSDEMKEKMSDSSSWNKPADAMKTPLLSSWFFEPACSCV
jgi:hypothetical protein